MPRLQDRFGDRWAIRRKIAVGPRVEGKEESLATTEKVNANVRETLAERRGIIRKRHRKTVEQVRFVGVDGIGSAIVERDVPVDVPRYEYTGKENFGSDFHLAMWIPLDPQGPTVYLNKEAPVLLEAVRYHQEQYPDIYAEEISKAVMDAYGEIAASKIAHSQKLVAHIAEQELDDHYRSEKALTIALMGLMAEEAVISQRLGRFGRKKAA